MMEVESSSDSVDCLLVSSDLIMPILASHDYTRRPNSDSTTFCMCDKRSVFSSDLKIVCKCDMILIKVVNDNSILILISIPSFITILREGTREDEVSKSRFAIASITINSEVLQNGECREFRHVIFCDFFESAIISHIDVCRDFVKSSCFCSSSRIFSSFDFHESSITGLRHGISTLKEFIRRTILIFIRMCASCCDIFIILPPISICNFNMHFEFSR